MAQAGTETQSVERASDFGTDKAAIARRWSTEIKLAQKDREKWQRKVRKIVKRYRDEDRSNSEAEQSNSDIRFNVLWSNEQTLGPAVYAKPPKPVVERRYLNRDPIGRTASMLLERTLAYQIEVGRLDDAIRLCRKDYLLAGQGVTWVRYEPTYEAADDKTTETEGTRSSEGIDDAEPDATPEYTDAAEPTEETAEPAQYVADEKTCVDYVNWDDYLCSPARTEDEITWKARRVFMTRDQLTKRFGPKIGKNVTLDYVPKNMSSDDAAKPENELFKKATVWEIWNKTDGEVVFIAEHYLETPLEVVKDPLHLEGFWPTPKPCMATTTNDTVVPVPDYCEYQDQAAELDKLTARISLLTDAIKAAGVYDSSWPQLARLLEEGEENKLYPVDQWAAFAEKGGIPGAVSMLPIKEMADVLIGLYEARSQVKRDLYELTGIGDIVRGQAEQGGAKTATEQRIKGSFANLRLSDRQGEMARFCRDTLSIMAEIVSEHFAPETIRRMSGYDQWGIEQFLPEAPQQQQQGPQDGQPPGMGHNGGPPMMPPPQAAQPPAGGIPAPEAGLPPGVLPPNGGAQASPEPAMNGAPPRPAPPMNGRGMPPGPVMPPPPPPDPMEIARQKAEEQFNKAIELLRNEKLRGFRIDVETDSTIEPDQQAEKQARVEFLTASAQFLGQAVEMGANQPEFIPVLGKMFLFGVRGFRVGRELEASFEEMLDRLEKKAANPQPRPPTPEEIKAKTELQKQRHEDERAKMENAARQQEIQNEAAAKAQDRQMEQQAKQSDIALKQREMQMEAEFKSREHQMKLREMELKEQLEMAKHQREMEKLHIEMVTENQRNAVEQENQQREQALEEQSMERQAEFEEQKMDRQEEADERKAELQEKTMRAKAKQQQKEARS